MSSIIPVEYGIEKFEYGDEHEFVYGADYDAEFGGLFGNVGRLLSNATKSAGRAIGKAEKRVVNGVGKVGKAITKIPVVGAPIKTIFDAAYHAAVAPMRLTVDIAKGKRIDKAFMARINEGAKDFKAVGPYAQMIFSVVPGVGTGISAALGAGLALANGQPIQKALLAGVTGAMPGGPAAKAALSAAIDGVQSGVNALVKHEKFNIKSALESAGKSAAGSVLPKAAMAGIEMVSGIAHGKRLDAAVVDGALGALPVADSIKKALKSVSQVSIDLASGKKIDAIVLAQVKNAVPNLPIPPEIKNKLMDVAKTGKEIAKGAGTLGLASALHSAVADSVLHIGTKDLQPDIKKAVQTGLALGAATVNQKQKAVQLTSPTVINKLIESGIQLSKVDPVVAEARKLAGAGTRGFDVAIGLTNSKSDLFSIANIREQLKTPADKMGFDMGLSAKVGLVTQPVPKGMSPAAVAGNAITHGMQGSAPQNNKAIMKVIAANPSAAVGAQVAVKEIAVAREHWVRRMLRALRLV